jgi:hypothetical protein
MNLPSINFDKSGRLTEMKNQLAKFLEKHSRWLFFGLLLTGCAYAAVIFYSFILKAVPPIMSESKIRVKTELYEEIMQRLQQRQANIEQATNSDYRDIFK